MDIDAVPTAPSSLPRRTPPARPFEPLEAREESAIEYVLDLVDLHLELAGEW